MGLALQILFSLLTLAVAAEAGARIYLKSRGRFHVWKPGTRLRLRLDPDVFPGMPPDVRFEINEEGERGGPPPEPGDPGVYRILVAGGSAGECYFLDQAASWPGQVEARLSAPEALAKLGRERVHLGNIAKSLYGSEYLDRVFDRVLAQYPRLDLIVVMVGATDVVQWLGQGAPKDVPDRPATPDQLFEEHPGVRYRAAPRASALAEVAKRLRTCWFRPVDVRERAGKKLGEVRAMRKAAREVRDSVPDPAPMLARFERHFRILLRRAAHKARVLVVHQPCFDRPHTPEEEARFWGGGIGNPYHEKVTVYYTWEVVGRLMRQMNERAAAVADELGIQRVDLMPVLPKDLATYYDFFHFTPAGAERVADEVVRAILAPPPAAPARSAAPAARR